MIKKIFAIIGLVLLVGYLALAGVIYRVGGPSLVYKGIDVNINDSTRENFVTISDVRQQLRNAKLNPVGLLVDSVNTLEITNLLEKNRLIKKAYCYHTPDSMLRIDIEQRHPIIRVKSLTHGDFYVDSEGEVMPVQNIVAMQIPLATGYVSKEKAASDLFSIAKNLREDKFWNKEITQIYVNQNGDIELIPRIGSHSILIGSSENFDKKLKNVRTFYDKVLSKKGWNYYKVINVKFDNQVVGEK